MVDNNHLRGRERQVQKEADLGRGEDVSQHLRQHGEVVVVHPDEVAVPVHVLDGVCEALIHGLRAYADIVFWARAQSKAEQEQSKSKIILKNKK